MKIGCTLGCMFGSSDVNPEDTPFLLFGFQYPSSIGCNHDGHFLPLLDPEFSPPLNQIKAENPSYCTRFTGVLLIVGDGNDKIKSS